MKNKPSFCENKPLFYEKQVVVLRKSFYDEMHQTGKSVVFALYPRNADEFVPPFWVQVKDFGEISPKGIAVSVEFSLKLEELGIPTKVVRKDLAKYRLCRVGESKCRLLLGTLFVCSGLCPLSMA